MFIELSIPSGNAKHTRKRSTNLVLVVKSCTISMLPLCQRVTRQYESLVVGTRRSGNIKFSVPSPYPIEQIITDLRLLYRGDVNLRECSMGRVYTGVYNYIWRDIKRQCIIIMGEGR